MTKIISKKFSPTVARLTKLLENQAVQADLLVSNSEKTLSEFAQKNVGVCKVLFLVGNVGEMATMFADTFSMAMFYDTFAEKNLFNYCKLTKTETPSQRVRESVCFIPESFNHFASSYGYQCAAYGVLKKTHVYIVPDDERECQAVFDNYVVPNLFKRPLDENSGKFVFKVFGLQPVEVETRLSKLNSAVIKKSETAELDTKITLIFPPKFSKSVAAETITQTKNLFADNLYAASDISLAEAVVKLFSAKRKTLSLAESMTGGMIASSLVDVPGASAALYEGLVTYAIESKCNRLGINPHFVDMYGVVSPQVAEAMAKGLLQTNRADAVLSVTGYASQTPDPDCQAGLCFIGIGSGSGVATYRNKFVGDRNSVRKQATNTALFLLLKTFQNA